MKIKITKADIRAAIRQAMKGKPPKSLSAFAAQRRITKRKKG